MDSSRPAEAPSLSPDVTEFVRFCYRRRRVGWPELYDEMCAVAGRGLYQGWRFAELEEHGIGFSLQQTLELARIAAQVAQEEGDRHDRVPARSTGARATGGVPGTAPERAAIEAPAELSPTDPTVTIQPATAADVGAPQIDSPEVLPAAATRVNPSPSAKEKLPAMIARVAAAS